MLMHDMAGEVLLNIVLKEKRLRLTRQRLQAFTKISSFLGIP